MTIAERMTRLLTTYPGCRSLVFGDIATATVLRGYGLHGERQEDYDALLAQAARLFGPPGTHLLAEASGAAGAAASVQRALVVAADATHLFLRDAAAPDEVICAVCTPIADLAALEPELNRLLSDHG